MEHADFYYLMNYTRKLGASLFSLVCTSLEQ